MQQQVLTKVASIEFSKPLENPLSISSTSKFDGTVRLRVTDSSGRGVSGKYIKDATHSVASPHSNSDLIVSTRNDLEEFSVSDSNGFMSIPFKINVVKQASLSVTFTFLVDGLSVVASAITITGNLQTVPDHCAYIETQTAPPTSTTNGNPFMPVYKALKQDGSPWVGGSATLGVVFTTDYPYKIKPSLINSVQASAATTTSDASGLLTFTNFQFLQQPDGTVFLQAQGANSGTANCLSDFEPVTVQDTVISI